MANLLIKPKQSGLFAVKETTFGTLVFPTSADALALAGDASLDQNPSYTDSEEIINSRDVLAQFQNMTPMGDWSFTTYCRPSGTAGTAPAEDVLWECLLGTKTVTGSTSVVYTPGMTLSGLSVWLKEGNVVTFGSGAYVEKLDLKSDATGALKLSWSGKFCRLGWAGESALAEAISATPDTSVVVGDARLYTVGARIHIVDADGTDDNNTNAGYAVTAVNTSTNTLTVTPGIASAHLTTATVKAYLPTVASIEGEPVEARDRVLKLATVATSYKSFGLSIANGNQGIEDEVTTSGYPTAFAEGTRNIDGSFDTHFRTNDLARFTDAQTGDPVDIDFTYNAAAAGHRLRIQASKARLQKPKSSTSGAVKQLATGYKCLATNGEDSISITFT